MSRILIITSGITSIVNSSLVMAKRLEKSGHNVTYGSFSNISASVARADIPFVSLPDIQKLTSNPKTHNSKLIGSLEPFLTTMTGGKFDLTIIDIECHEYIVTYRSFSHKLVLLSTFLSLWRRPGLPPMHYPVKPDRNNPNGKSSFYSLWLRHVATKMLFNRLQKIRRSGKDRISNIERLAELHQFPWKQKKDETQWLNPVFYRDIPVINLNDPQLDFPHTPHNDAYYVGPMHNTENAEQLSSLDVGEHKRLQQIIERNQKAQNRPLIYCAFGRFKASYDKSFIQKVISISKQQPEWDILISLGGHMSCSDFEQPPDNVHLFSWLPQTKILVQSSCAVIHSGISSINECVQSEVPMVLYSLGIRDQEGNAARASFHHLGVRGSRMTDTSDDIARHIRFVIQDAKIKHALRVFSSQAKHFQINLVLENTINDLIVWSDFTTPDSLSDD